MGAVLKVVFRYLKSWLVPLFTSIGQFLHVGEFFSKISWRKVLFAAFLASMLLAFGQVLLSFSSSLQVAFRSVFSVSGGVIGGGSGASLGVLGWFGLGRVIDLVSVIPCFSNFAYVFGLDWVLWGATECMLLWLVDVGLHRIMVWAGTLVRVAYDAL